MAACFRNWGRQPRWLGKGGRGTVSYDTCNKQPSTVERGPDMQACQPGSHDRRRDTGIDLQTYYSLILNREARSNSRGKINTAGRFLLH